jgi:Rab5 GDP/GTP exchange factor
MSSDNPSTTLIDAEASASNHASIADPAKAVDTDAKVIADDAKVDAVSGTTHGSSKLPEAQDLPRSVHQQLEPLITPKHDPSITSTPLSIPPQGLVVSNSSNMSGKNAADNVPPPPPPKDEKYSQKTTELDPEKEAYKKEDMDFEPAIKAVEGGQAGDDSRSEIQSIMEQFDPGMGGPGAEEIMSPRLEIAGPLLGSPAHTHPPRKSSLEPLRSVSHASLSKETSISSDPSQPIPQPPSLASSSTAGLGIIELAKSQGTVDTAPSPTSSRQHAPLPPQPDPEPDLPFDFHRFLEQLRHRTADPVAKFLRSFLLEFGKKQWMVHEQVKIISDFLEFITKKMAQCEVWRTVSDGEFDNACEGMEKLVMNRLYSQTFSPAIPPPDPALAHRRKSGQPPPGRRGQHQEDVERDEILAQKVGIYSWVREEHLDIKPLNDKGKKFLVLAQQGLFFIAVKDTSKDSRITQDRQLSSAPGQGHLRLEFLQSDFW